MTKVFGYDCIFVVTKRKKNMENYQILISGYRNGYLTTELIKVQAQTIEEAIFLAENKSTLDGATARI
jgi:hypothetical protein